MDINEISDVPTDAASESTFESEFDALSKIITDTKDDMHKLNDNDEVFKLDSNDIAFTDSMQGHSAESNKCDLIPDDGLAIGDILDGTTDLENFIPTSNVDSDLQEVLGETFETSEDPSYKSIQNSLEDQTTAEKNDEIALPVESCVNNELPIDDDSAQKSQSYPEDQPFLALEDRTCESLSGTGMETCQEPMEKIENSGNDNQEDLILSDYLSEFSENDHSKNIVDEKLDAVEESTVDCVATRSSENESADQTDFAQASSFPSVNPECSDIIFNNQVDDNLKKDPSIDTEEQLKDSKIEDLKTLLGEVKSCAKDNDIAELSNDPPIVQQTLESIEQDIICHAKQSEEMLVSNKSNYEEGNSCHAKQFSEEILISNENNDNEFMKENMQPTDEPNIDEIPTTVPLEKEKKMEEETSKDFQTANNLTGTTDLENVNEDKNENMLASDCQELVSESGISENFEAANTELKNVENDSVAETSCNIQSEIENKEHVENAENVNDQSTMESTPDPELEKQDNPTTETVFEEPSSVNTETEMPISLEKIEGNSSPSNGVDKEQLMSTVNEKDIKPVEQAESSLVTQDLSENIATLNDPLNDSIANITSAEVKEILDEKKTSNTDEDVIEASCSEQESDSQVISNMLNETEKDLNSDLSNLLETKEAVSEDISNFGNSKILSDQNFQSLEEKSQDPLSVRDTVANQMDNEKSSPCEKADDITFGESSQSPTPMQNDKFISDLYDSCMPDDTSQFSNVEVENSKASADLGNAEPAVEIEDQELMETDALEENASELMFEEAQANKGSNEPPSEISELESAVKFLQESEQSTETLQVATAGEGNPSVFVAVEEGDCDNATEMASDLPEMTLDPIAISEAEIISEAAKLETERKEKLEQDKLKQVSEKTSDSQMDDEQAKSSALSSTEISDVEPSDKLVEALSTSAQDSLQVPITARLTTDYLPKSGVLDERYKEPLKLEIPESSKLVELPDNALTIHKQRLESPERQASSGEPKISDTPTKRDNSDKQQPMECENVGSPRIILKIAKSAIAECSEPRSPKSPKVRSSDSPNREDSPSSQKLGKIKLKLSKGGHPSIIPSGDSHEEQELAHKADDSRKSESPIGMKIKLSKSGDASIVQQDNKETAQETTTGKKQDSPSLGMKIKLSKSGDASIIQQDKPEHVDDDGTKRTESPIGMKIKLSKSGDASVISSGSLETAKESIDEPIKRTDSPIGVKIKLAKNKGGSASIISTENVEEVAESSTTKSGLGMKIKLSKSGDASVIHTSKDDVHEATEQHIGMKIKLSKTGDPSIIPSGYSREYEDIAHRTKHSKHKDHGASQRSKDDSHLEMKIKLSKTGHPTIVTSTDSVVRSLKAATPLQENDADIISFKKSHSDVTIEPIKSQSTETTMVDLHGKRKEISISPIESKKPKVDAGTKQMIPDVTLQPLAAKKEHHQKLVLDSNAGSISRQQMSVINQEISITPISATASGDSLMGEHLRNALNVPTGGSTPSSSDCEIIEAQPELIIVNENSNSSQDVMIIEEVVPPVKAPKKRGRPRRNALPAVAPAFQAVDPLSLEQPRANAQYPPQTQLQAALLQQVPPQHIIPPAGDGTERPRRTCRNQKSYAPPKRGRGRGRGKRKNEALDIPAKKPRMEQEFVGTEHTAKPVIALQKLPLDSNSGLKNSPELFKALNQPSLNQIAQQARSAEILQVPGQAKALSECEVIEIPEQSSSTRAVQEGGMEVIKIPSHAQVPSMHLSSDVQMPQAPTSKHLEQTIGENGAIVIKVSGGDEGKQSEEQAENGKESIQSNQNWLAPSIKKVSGEAPSRTETISSLTVIDEETRMSAESGSRSQTPARTMPAPGVADTLVNEESQNSVLSTATTESEKVKQPRNRRMEICLDADEGPFTVDRIAEYEWPPSDRINEPKSAITRGETFMVQEQISQYLGVKSFKRKYPDLKRRMVDMEERNFLRENALVSESMCDMGLTAVSSSEVLDIMCSDFPEQYEEYRKYVREKAAREHSKRQKELSAAANAERNRIDLAEMAMQSATSWNSGFNKARQDSRRCSLDLQTYTVHIPRQPFKYNPSRRGNNYPCALITGQYTDYYREYKPAELRYYPLNTVVYGPTRPNERKFDSQSEGSQSDSDSDSSSDDSSSTSSEGTQDTEGSQSTMDEVDMELALDPSIKCKMCSNHLNKNNRPETLIVCGTCNGNVHPSCIDLTLDMVPHIRAYAWQCTDCKTCAQCHDPADEDKMLFCDMCDRGYHIYCVGLRRVPQGRWHCQECAVCANCGSKEPGGANSDRNSVAQWQHEFKKGDKNTRVYVSTFCVPCSKLWRKGRYCPHCSRCHNATRLDQEPNLVHCGACDKYLHLECVETKGMTIDRRNYLCEFCSPNRQHLVKPLTSKTFKT